MQNGYDVGGLDGLIGIKTRQSLGKYQEKIRNKKLHVTLIEILNFNIFYFLFSSSDL